MVSPTTRSPDNDQLARVAALRAEGLTPKEIARSLGLRPAAVTLMIRKLAAQRAADTQFEVTGCWVSPGWRRNLAVTAHHDWPDGPATEGSDGLTGVVVARRERPNRVSVASYLVDTYCLGVKNAMGPDSMSERNLPTFLRGFFSAFGPETRPLEAPLELARHLVWGAVDHARRLGFEPHPDFAPVSDHLGTWDETSAITFGREGVPFYVSGPHDNPYAVIHTLTRTVGEGNFHYLAMVG